MAAETVIDRWRECLNCHMCISQSNTEPPVCPVCQSRDYVYKYSVLNDTTHAATTNKDRLEATEFVERKLLPERAEAKGKRKKHFTIPRDMLR